LGLAELTEQAPAKVNLFLHVVGRRADRYHFLDSLVVFADVADTLRAEPAESVSLAIEGPFSAELATDPDNLVLRAARLLAAEMGIAAHGRLFLSKHLPVASGIGGGSADAAAALRLLCRLWRVEADPLVLTRVAARLGADVPVCLAGRASRMQGIGDRLHPAPALPNCGIALVNPGVALATAEVFRARRGAWSVPADLPVSWRDADEMVTDLARQRNDLQPPAIMLQPVISEVISALEAVPGCLLARMSGSGATCFGLFADQEAACQAAAGLQRPGWWSWGGSLRPD
jgi:4-diphosphocytidyl-2-C-methyl-D-erythritol kinase